MKTNQLENVLLSLALGLIGACITVRTKPEVRTPSAADQGLLLAADGPPAAAPSEREALRTLEGLAAPEPGMSLDLEISTTAEAWAAPSSGETPRWAKLDLALLAILRCSDSAKAGETLDLLLSNDQDEAAGMAAPEERALRRLAEARQAYEQDGVPLLPAGLELSVLGAGTKTALASHRLVEAWRSKPADRIYSLDEFSKWARANVGESKEENGYLHERLAHTLGSARAALDFQAQAERGQAASPDAWLQGARLLVGSIESRMWGPVSEAEFRLGWDSFAGTGTSGKQRRVWDRDPDQPTLDAGERAQRTALWCEKAAQVRFQFGKAPVLPILRG
jgi:hypothetical protein